MEISTLRATHISAALGLLGFIVFILLLPTPKTLDSADISKIKIGEKVKISGIIKEVKIRNGNAFLEIENNAIAQAFYYKPGKHELSILHQNNAVEITGMVSRYKGKKEIIAERVLEIE